MAAALVNLVIYLIVLGILYAIVVYVLDTFSFPEPANKIIRVVAVVLIALVAVVLLLELTGSVNTGLPKVMS